MRYRHLSSSGQRLEVRTHTHTHEHTHTQTHTGRWLIDSHGLWATTSQVIAVKMSLASAAGVGAHKVGPVHAAAPRGPHMQVHVRNYLVPHQHNAGSTGRQRRRHQYPLARRHARQQHGARLELHEALLASKDLNRTWTKLHMELAISIRLCRGQDHIPTHRLDGCPINRLAVNGIDNGACPGGRRRSSWTGHANGAGLPRLSRRSHRTPHAGRTWWRFRAHRTNWSLSSRGANGAFDSRVARRTLLAWGACGSLRRNSENSVP